MTTYQKSSLQEIVQTLQNGQKWLTENFREWLGGQEFTDEDRRLFDAGLERWERFERLYQATAPTICIWGNNKKCPSGAPVVCVVCETPTHE